MCTDFTNLNLKDYYPLPCLGRLVDGGAGHEVKDFVDASRGYHQILLEEADQEKTNLITEFGLYCWKRLEKGQLRINPEKCSFGVISDKFLGFMISERGIEPNPDKIEAIMQMEAPKSYKVQRSATTHEVFGGPKQIHILDKTRK
ncbi:hypothetical protein LIER_36835 [Lithospermum erythrorhizon]|uniref:Reverse transcriptase n=1 Tax=Lithospermum erythrorhizon TaxID=34254 RepID=A0AAV3PB69_LITER